MKEKSSTGIGKPSKRQAEILQFAREYRRENGYSPSLTEIAKYFDMSFEMLKVVKEEKPSVPAKESRKKTVKV